MTLALARSEPLLQADDLSVTFATTGRRVEAVRGVSLAVHRGEVLAVIGESGSGKSTLARAILGLTPPHSGTLRLDGERVPLAVTARSRVQRRKLGMVFQDSGAAFNPRFSVARILNEPIRLLGGDAGKGAAEELLDAVGLSGALLGRRPHELSGGQRQRVGIARALAGNPEVLICDEAVSALDLSVQAQILNLLADLLLRRGLAILFITHDISVVSYLADRIAVMHQGKIVESGPASAVLDTPRMAYTRTLLASAPEPVLRG